MHAAPAPTSRRAVDRRLFLWMSGAGDVPGRHFYVMLRAAGADVGLEVQLYR